MNIREVARLANVSPSTVSRVLNGTKAVSPDVKSRVLQVVWEHGYIPNSAKRHSRTIAVVIPRTFTSHGWSGEILDGILDGAKADAVTLIREETLAGSTVHYWHQQVRQAGLKGVLLVAGEHTEPIANSVRQTGLPYVVIGRGKADDSWVWCDNVLVVAQALERLYREGHRRIAFIGYAGPQTDHTDRLTVYRAFVAARALEKIEVLLDVAKPLTGDIVSVMDAPAPPTAIFVAGSNTALYALSLLAERGVAVPEDIAFVAFGPHPMLRARRPPIYLIERSLRAGARTAVEKLLSMHESPAEGPVQLRLPSRLLRGDQELELPPIPEDLRARLAEYVGRSVNPGAP